MKNIDDGSGKDRPGKELKTIKELHTAMLEPPSVLKISEDIVKMFASDSDLDSNKSTEEQLPKIIQRASNRFISAREIYESFWNNGNPTAKYAIFYKLEDRETMENLYMQAYSSVVEDLKKELKLLKYKNTTVREVNKILEAMRAARSKAASENQSVDKKLEIIDFLLTKDTTESELRQPITEQIMDAWYGSPELKSSIRELAKNRFFQTNYFAAMETGCIYSPSADLHNWGVNACWTLAVTRARVPIKILSPLTTENLTRRHPNPNEPINPSAFSLEIAIAIKMGYGLNIEGNKILMVPPTKAPSHETTGPGNGPLPTKSEQVSIYTRCRYAYEMHHMLSRGEPDTLTKYIVKFCSSEFNVEKFDFTWGLHYLQLGNCLMPILNALKAEQLDLLIKVIEEQFLNLEIFKRLRTVVHSKRYQNLIEEAFHTKDEQKQKSLIEKLHALDEKEEADAIFAILPFESLGKLLDLMRKPIFSDPKYTDLHHRIQIYHFAKFMNENAENMKMINEWMTEILKPNLESQNVHLIEALLGLNERIRSAILNNLTLTLTENLLAILSDKTFEEHFANKIYQDLKGTLVSLLKQKRETPAKPLQFQTPSASARGKSPQRKPPQPPKPQPPKSP